MKNIVICIIYLVALYLLVPLAVCNAAQTVVYLTPEGGENRINCFLTALQEAECDVRIFDWSDLGSLENVDVLVLGGAYVRDADFRAEVFSRQSQIVKFLVRGGVLLDFAGAAPTDYWPHYLPMECKLEFTDGGSSELLVLHPRHVVGAALKDHVTVHQDETSPQGSAPFGTRSIHRQRGFRVIAASDSLGMYGLFAETAVGSGRAYICTIPVDGPYQEARAPNRDSNEQIAKGVVSGIVKASESIRSERMPDFIPDQGADLRTPSSWRIIVLPDTQCYVDQNKAEANERHFHRQTQWIVERKEADNIRYVLHTGDMTQHNIPSEWAKARKIMSELNGHVPYLVIPGNHDLGPGGNAYDRSTLMAGYFPISDARKYTGYAGSFQEDDPANVYHLLNAGEVDWLIIGLEFGPRDAVLRWAKGLVEKHPRHSIILVTHAYLYDDDTRFDFKTKGIAQAGNPQYYHIMALPGYANDGEQIWKGVVSNTKKASIVICGHVLGDGLGYRCEKNVGGENVAQMLVNFQQRNEGGEGYLRILEFSKDSRTIRVMDYSPSLDRFLPGGQSQFLIELRR